MRKLVDQFASFTMSGGQAASRATIARANSWPVAPAVSGRMSPDDRLVCRGGRRRRCRREGGCAGRAAAGQFALALVRVKRATGQSLLASVSTSEPDAVTFSTTISITGSATHVAPSIGVSVALPVSLSASFAADAGDCSTTICWSGPGCRPGEADERCRRDDAGDRQLAARPLNLLSDAIVADIGEDLVHQAVDVAVPAFQALQLLGGEACEETLVPAGDGGLRPRAARRRRPNPSSSAGLRSTYAMSSSVRLFSST